MFKKIILAGAVTAATSVGSSSANMEVADIARQAELIQANPKVFVEDDFLKNASSVNPLLEDIALGIGDESARQTLEELSNMTPEQQREREKSVMGGYKYLLFASFSLGEQGLKDLFVAIAGRDDAAVVFRGIPEGMRIDEAMYAIQEIAKQVEPIPNVMLHPALFVEHSITVVPTLVMRDENKQSMAFVRGLFRPDWIKEQVEEHGKTGDLGFLGPAELIAERDLTEVMMERAEALDWEEKKRGAVKRGWDNTYMAKLPPAREDRERKIPASVLVTKDVLTDEGEVVAKKGDIINPLDVRPFTIAYIAFNPGRPSEAAYVKQLREKVLAEGKYNRVELLFTELDLGDDGWAAFKDMTDDMGSHVFNLVPEVQRRFAIEATPSLVTADRENFIVQEFKVTSADLDEQAIQERTLPNMEVRSD